MYEDLSTESIQNWLAGHQACIDLKMNVGQLDIKKAQEFRLELIRRTNAEVGR